MPSGRSFYHRRPARYATEKKEFQRLITELKRLVSKRGYSLAQIASGVGVTQVTINHWWTGHSLMAQRSKLSSSRCSLINSKTAARALHHSLLHISKEGRESMPRS